VATSVVVLGLVAILAVACALFFLKLSFAIRREDKRRSLRSDAPSFSAKAARDLVGISSSRWD
jgi:hypothetical protein